MSLNLEFIVNKCFELVLTIVNNMILYIHLEYWGVKK